VESSDRPELGLFSFEGIDVEAFLSGDGDWHLRSAGCEVSGRHLGTATRVLFNPKTHASTRPLIDEILHWQASARASSSGFDSGEDWLTAPRRR
jgi:hypothetical protein